ncbi:MAG: T9SS type A sorting domain-containing protein [Fibrobacteria bacterium]|nr:T9SS type A sorting domain-containing protein [Fibrobacteria bacterium]
MKKPFITVLTLFFLFTGLSHGQKIAFAMHTVHKGVLKMNVQLFAQGSSYGKTAILEINDGDWKAVDTATVITAGWTALFRVENWDQTKDMPYRINYSGDSWSGVVRKDPVDKDTIVVAAFTGNATDKRGGELTKQDIVDNMTLHGADLLFFSGDQVYNHTQHFQNWIQFGKDFGELFRDIPVVCLPDDHDAGQGNLFGEGGIKASGINGYNNGGYINSADYVKEVERAQTAHLPDPFDATPVAQGIGVYYTDLTVGGVNFAIIEDRKFKTGPQGVVPDAMWQASQRPDHIKVNTPGYTPEVVDVPEAVLLGERQLNFLEAWAADWKNGITMKSVLSATIFANCATHHHTDGELTADLDSNGWPQTGRNKALKLIRKAFAVMIAGDQHLATMVHHGVDAYGDAGYSLCVPSIANYYPRAWLPRNEGQNRQPGMPDYIGTDILNVGMVNHHITGDFEDGFGNKMTVWAVANPHVTGKTPSELHDWVPGYGIVKFNKPDRTITLENWPRQANPRTDAQYKGWPLTIAQTDNYGRKAVQYLPTLDIKGMTDPVVQIINEATSEKVYTLRIKGTSFRPKVFAAGTYTIKVGEPGTEDLATLPGIQSLVPDSAKTLTVTVGEVKTAPQPKAKSGNAAFHWDNSLQKLAVKITGNESFLIDVVEPSGRVIYTRIISGAGNYFVSVPELKSKVYLIKARSKSQQVTKKIIVVK